MKREDLVKLLGGYATNTLTDEERSLLFEAALNDQQLFNALADEQALRELLDDPSARAELLRSFPDETASLLERFKAWFARPAGWMYAGGLVAASVIIAVAIRSTLPRSVPQIAVSEQARVSVAPPAAITERSQPSAAKREAAPPQLMKAKPLRVEVAATPPAMEEFKDKELPAPTLTAAAPPQPQAVADRPQESRLREADQAAPAVARSGMSARQEPRAKLAASYALPGVPVEGKVISVKGNILELNIGSGAGIKIGDKLEVRRKTAEGFGRIGEVTVTKVEGQSSTGKYEGPAPAAEGDMVVLPSPQ